MARHGVATSVVMHLVQARLSALLTGTHWDQMASLSLKRSGHNMGEYLFLSIGVIIGVLIYYGMSV